MGSKEKGKTAFAKAIKMTCDYYLSYMDRKKWENFWQAEKHWRETDSWDEVPDSTKSSEVPEDIWSVNEKFCLVCWWCT